MNADGRLVPSQYITKVLAENKNIERAEEARNKLEHSMNKLDTVACRWMQTDNINCLSRVMLRNASHMPRTKRTHTTPKTTTGAHHGSTLAQKREEKHGHDREHEHNHHDNHAHVSESEHHDSRLNIFLSIIIDILRKTGGYLLNLLALILIFGPTRTALLTSLIVVGINIYFEATLPVGIITGIILVAHLVFSAATRLAQSNGEGSHGHGGDEHGHSEASHGHH